MVRFLKGAFALISLLLITVTCIITFSEGGQRYFEEQMRREASYDCINLDHVIDCDPPKVSQQVDLSWYENRVYGPNAAAVQKLLEESKARDPTAAAASELNSAVQSANQNGGIDWTWWTLHLGLPLGAIVVIGATVFIIRSVQGRAATQPVPEEIREEARKWTPANMRRRIVSLETVLAMRDDELMQARKENDELRTALIEKEELIGQFRKANEEWEQECNRLYALAESPQSRENSYAAE